MPDLRWGQRSYSVIVTYDLKTKKKRTLTANTQLFAPALSPDGKRIAAVEFTPANECSLVLLDADTGAELKRYANAENEFIQTPHWSLDGKSIVYTKINSLKGKAIAIVNADTGADASFPYTAQNLYYPVSDGKFVYFVSPHSGIDNIYAVNIATKKVFQVTSRKFGAYYPSLSPDGKKLAFNDVTADGYTAVEMDLDPAQWIPIEKVRGPEPPLLRAPHRPGGGRRHHEEHPRGSVRVEKIQPFHAPLQHPHLAPHGGPLLARPVPHRFVAEPPGDRRRSPPGTYYNWNENTHAGILSVSYAGCIPVIDAGLFYGTRVLHL